MGTLTRTPFLSSLALPSPADGGVAVVSGSSRPEGARGLAALLLAAMVAALAVVADRLITSWVDGHLLLAWVLLWVVVFAALALLAKPTRVVARRALGGLHAVSAQLADARAQARLWEMAQSDPRLMQELRTARAHASTLREEVEQGFSQALAPLGMEQDVIVPKKAPSVGLEAFAHRLATARAAQLRLYYI